MHCHVRTLQRACKSHGVTLQEVVYTCIRHVTKVYEVHIALLTQLYVCVPTDSWVLHKYVRGFYKIVYGHAYHVMSATVILVCRD